MPSKDSPAATATFALHDDDDELASLDQAEAEAIAAQRQAANARARAREFRRRASLGQGASADRDENAESESEPTDSQPADTRRPSYRSRLLRRPAAETVAGFLAVLAIIALLAASGYMAWFHQQVGREDQRRAEFAAAAAQAVVTLMSIDGANAEENVKQIVANSTGQFRDDFQSATDDFVKAAQDSKSVTKATARASAVESMSPDSAVVLVTAATTISSSAGADQQPRSWRLSVTMLREGAQIKMSKVDFIP